MAEHWWQTGIIYHIYPRSFQDANGDGVGDLPGITRRLDYFPALGVDAIWLSPIFPSPMADFGYDVSNYTDIHPLFGTLADFDALLDAAHQRGVRVLLDWVPNHTSSQHPWFLASRSSRQDAHRDWYIWRRPAPDGGPPNNWLSAFGGPAWTLDEATGEYYLHSYLAAQPDLNWRNPAVREAMLGTLRFWLDRGVDGFRIDALRNVIKDDQFRDNPPNPDYRPGQDPHESLLMTYSADRPEVQDVVRAIRRTVDAYQDRVLVGELYLPIERLMAYYGEGGAGIQLPSNFHLLTTPWEASAIAALITRYEAALPAHGWPNWVLGNHDRSRVASRLGRDEARVAAMLLLTLRGTPTLYYGDELGMVDVPIPLERAQDPVERNVPGLGLGRDPERTPMRWDAGRNAGFTDGTPWLPLGDDVARVNVAIESDDPSSMLTLHRRLIALRRREVALHAGACTEVSAVGETLTYIREGGGARFLMALNLSARQQTMHHPALSGKGGSSGDGGGQKPRVELSTHLDRTEDVSEPLVLRPFEGVVVRL